MVTSQTQEHSSFHNFTSFWLFCFIMEVLCWFFLLNCEVKWREVYFTRYVVGHRNTWQTKMLHIFLWNTFFLDTGQLSASTEQKNTYNFQNELKYPKLTSKMIILTFQVVDWNVAWHVFCKFHKIPSSTKLWWCVPWTNLFSLEFNFAGKRNFNDTLLFTVTTCKV